MRLSHVLLGSTMSLCALSVATAARAATRDDAVEVGIDGAVISTAPSAQPSWTEASGQPTLQLAEAAPAIVTVAAAAPIAAPQDLPLPATDIAPSPAHADFDLRRPAAFPTLPADALAFEDTVDDASTLPFYGPADPSQPNARLSYASDDLQRLAGDHVARPEFSSFGEQFGQIKWEVAGFFAFYTAINSVKFWEDPRGLHFNDEGWFGSNTISLGVDKLVHAYNTYLITETLHHRLHRRTGGADGDAVTAAIIASGLMMYSELYDGIERTAGISVQDVLFNTAGAAFSALRHTVPGLDEKLDFRVMIMPNSDIYTRVGKEHYRQQRFLLAFQLSGFRQLDNSPLRFLELHVGYYATGFTDRERARGETPQQRPFFGIGLNVGELLFGRSQSRVGRAAHSVLNYVQIPYTAAHWDITGDFTQ